MMKMMMNNTIEYQKWQAASTARSPTKLVPLLQVIYIRHYKHSYRNRDEYIDPLVLNNYFISRQNVNTLHKFGETILQ